MCHDNSNENALRPPFDDAVDILMTNGLMPPGRGVTDDRDREEALKVMTAAYRVKLKAYFLAE